MRERIAAELERLERQEGVRIVFAAESGSRAWGFPSRDSDWDVRFVYARPIEWYLAVRPGRDVIERPVDDSLDLSGWDVRKALHLFRRGNAALIEWLDSPMIYREDRDFAESLRTAAARYPRPKAWTHHYLSMAKKNYREYLRRDVVRVKKYFYVLRPLLACRWMQRTDKAPSMQFGELLAGAELKPEMNRRIGELLRRKKEGPELAEEPRIQDLNDFIEAELAKYEGAVAELRDGAKPPWNELDDLFRHTLHEAWA